MHHVELALAAIDSGVREVRSLNTGTAEPLTIACMTDDSRLLQQFLLESPDITLNHHRTDISAVAGMLERQEVDLALTVLEPSGEDLALTVLEPSGEDLAFERLYECDFMLLLNEAHPLARQASISRKELLGEHLAIDGSQVNRSTLCAVEGKMGCTPIIDYDVRHPELLLSLVEHNRCISIVPAVKYRELVLSGKGKSLVCLPYSDGAPTAYLGIAYNTRKPLNAQGKRFRDFVQSYFRGVDQKYEALVK